MSFSIPLLTQSLHTGFIDKAAFSNQEYRPQLLVNDKNEGKKVLTTIESQLKKCDEFWLSVAFVTTSGVAVLKNTLLELEANKIKGRILVSQYLNFTHPEALRQLLKFKNVELKIATKGEFHSKGYLFKHGSSYDLVIGSSNLTGNALCSNTEWNLKVTASTESEIVSLALKEFAAEFEKATIVDATFISAYSSIYTAQANALRVIKEKLVEEIVDVPQPNLMQQQALQNIKALRDGGQTKGLLISATGTGKTYLSAFDVKRFNPKRFLFVVHRLNIAAAAMNTFKCVFGHTKTMGLYSGGQKDIEKDFIFSTVQTISKEDNLAQFDAEHFDYIVIDETHRAGAESYQRILNHFRPKFLLGMTATPERTDGLDIFRLFNHNIAYEIRLHHALAENMLSPFHYYGVTDITVGGNVLEDNSDFKHLTSPERIKHIVQKASLYGCDNGNVRGLIFCSKVEEANALSIAFNEIGFKTIALSGSSLEEERNRAISLLETDDAESQLDYIFTVDIFNEGIDIPRVNQIIMLRPTQSAIIFVQQLGRGLRKLENKEYLTVIDFIGNYSNNYLVPIALYGDTSYNKDSLRKFMASGSSLIPGSSTINFDKISQERIYEAIDSANMQQKKDLVKDYNLLKFKLGRIPMMVDFIEHGSRDPFLYVSYSRSYFNFVAAQEDALRNKLNKVESKLLELFSKEINNAVRIEESFVLLHLIQNGKVDIGDFKKLIKDRYHYSVSNDTLNSCLINLNFEFITTQVKGKMVPVQQTINLPIVKMIGNAFVIEPAFLEILKKDIFVQFLTDTIEYAIRTYDNQFKRSKFYDGFILYRKYSRKDVFRILNWPKNPNGLNVGGYIVSKDKTNCPIFVNYHKAENISETTKYADGFINNREFVWMTKSSRYLDSPEVQLIISNKTLKLPLFIKKSNDEGDDLYYMGNVTPILSSIEETTMPNQKAPVVKMKFTMNHPVEENIYNYITQMAI